MRTPLIIFFLTYHQLSLAQYVNCNSELAPPTISSQYLSNSAYLNQSTVGDTELDYGFEQNEYQSICNNQNAQIASEIATSEINSEKALLSNKYYQEALQKANGQ